jgi:serine/threonine protein kinase
VRRLVQQEDLRAVADGSGRPAQPTPYGFVELTPDREYLLVTEFFDGATELGDAEVDEGVIDDGLGIIRRLWDAGLAHRDIKPANLLVRDRRLLLIDVAFVQARPSPWRQAVDLANMMLCLALRSSPEVVYQRALGQFTVEEITEGFAAPAGWPRPPSSAGCSEPRAATSTPSSRGCSRPRPSRSRSSAGAGGGSGSWAPRRSSWCSRSPPSSP